MRACSLPVDPNRNKQNSNNKWCYDFSRLPLRSDTPGECERHENTSEHGNQENDTNDVQMPEQLYGQLSTTKHFKGAFIRFELTGLLRATVNNKKYGYQRKRTDWVDNGKHANAPSPRSHREDRVSQITTNPSIDLSKMPELVFPSI